MAIADLVARLDRDADEKLAGVEAAASAEVERLVAEADRVVRERRAQLLATRRAERRARLDAALALARRRARAEHLAAQHALLDRVFARARDRVREIAGSPEVLAHAKAWLADGRRYLVGIPATATCDPATAAHLRSTAAEDGLVIVEDPEAPPGIRLAAQDGSATVDATLPSRVARLRARVAPDLLAEIDR